MLRFSIIALNTLICFSLHAATFVGGEISYTCLGSNNYRIQWVLYRNCADPPPAAADYTVNFQNACGLPNPTGVVLGLTGTVTALNTVCSSFSGNTTCSGNVLFGIEKYVYEGVINLPANCSEWTVFITNSGRSNTLTTITSVTPNWYVEAKINNFTGCHNSPKFTQPPVFTACENQLWRNTVSAWDPDGDSLVFSLICPRSNATTNLNWTAGLSCSQPVITIPAGGTSFNTVTGELLISSPAGGQQTVIAVKIDKYRNGTWLGSIMRDCELRTENCGSNSNPNITITSISGGVFSSGAVAICAGQSLNISFSAGDPNISDILYLNHNVSSFAGMSISTTGNNPINGTISWHPTNANVGYNYVTIRVSDNACTYPGQAQLSLPIRVTARTITQADTTICPGSSVVLHTTGGFLFNWTDISGGSPVGLSCTNCANPVATPNDTTVYVVTSNLSGSCSNKDTVIIYVATAPEASSNSPVCTDSSLRLFASPVLGAVAYQWSGPSGFSSTLQNPVRTPAVPGRYYVNAIVGSCTTRTDSIDVITVSTGSINVGKDLFSCLSTTGFQLNGTPPGGTWSGSPGVTPTGFFTPVIAGLGSHRLIYAFTGSCVVRDTLIIVVYNQLAEAGDSLLVCSSDAPFRLTTGTPAGGYWLGNGIIDSSLGLFDPAVAGVGVHGLRYSLYGGGCSFDNTQIRVVPGPVASVGSPVQFCKNVSTVKLTDGSPAGGKWIGTYVDTGGNFSPASMPAGSYQFGYVVTGLGGCTDTAYKTVNIIGLPVVSAGKNDTLCSNSGNYFLTGATPAGGSWSGSPAVSPGGEYNPSLAVNNPDTVVYKYFDTTGCSNTAIRHVYRINQVVDAGNNDTFCINKLRFKLGGSPTGGYWVGSGVVNDSLFDPSIGGAGVHALTYKIKTGPCIDSANKMIFVVLPASRPLLQLLPPDTLFCLSPARHYRWYKNDLLLADTGRYIIAKENGLYRVAVSNEALSHDCFSEKSDSINWIMVSTAPLFSTQDWLLYPNPPANNQLYLRTSVPIKNYRIQLFSALGSIVPIALEESDKLIRINILQKLASGNYWIRVTDMHTNEQLFSKQLMIIE